MALFGQVLQHARRGRPGAGRGLLAPRQAHLAEQDVAELLGRGEVERRADDLLDLGLDPRHPLRELAGQARQHLAVDRDAAPLHPRQRNDQRALQRLVDRRHAFGGEARLQHAPQPQRHVGVLGGVLRRLVDRHAREADEIAPRARDFGEVNGLVAEPALGERVHAVAVAGRARIERVGNQHGVVERRDFDAAPGEHVPVEFDVLADLHHARVFEQRLEQRDRLRFVDLAGRETAAAEEIGARRRDGRSGM